MYCPRCGNQLPDGAKFCTGCGAPVPKILPVTQQGRGDSQPLKAPEKKAPKQATIDVKNIVKNPPKIVSLRESIDFKGAEHALEGEALKTKAFSGLFSSAEAHEVRVDALTKIYEPIHMVRATYEGTFEADKEFNLQLDPDTVKVAIDKNTYDVKPPVANGGLFSGSSAPALKLTGTETIKKKSESGVYFDMKGMEKPMLEQLVKGKDTVPFDHKKKMPRTQVLETTFNPSGVTDRVLTPQIIQRPPNSKKTVDEKITVDMMTVYYPKYKATVTHLKNNQQKVLIISAVDKQLLSNETF